MLLYNCEWINFVGKQSGKVNSNFLLMIQDTEYTALVLVRKESFYEWLKMAGHKSGEEADSNFEGDYSTYLVKDVITPEDVHSFLQSGYREMFENELSQWHEREFWPSKLSTELFLEFFEVQVHRQVYHAG